MTKKDKRIEELLARVTPDQAEEIGAMMPAGLERPGREFCEVYKKYRDYMESLSFTAAEASELNCLCKEKR